MLDLFRYGGNGVKDLSFGGSTYFSLDGGATNSHRSRPAVSGRRPPGEPLEGQPRHRHHGPDLVPAGQANVITSRDIQAMDVIGWNLANSLPGSVSINDVQISEGNNGTRLRPSRSRAAAAPRHSTSTLQPPTAAPRLPTATTSRKPARCTSTPTSTRRRSRSRSMATPKSEANETFFVTLSGATNGATISDGQGIGTISNDDTLLHCRLRPDSRLRPAPTAGAATTGFRATWRT